jgi:hypothetical protein
MAVFKRLFFDVPGFGRVNAMAGGTIKLDGMKRESVMTDNGSAGPSEEPTAGELKFKLPNQAGLSLRALGDLKDVEVTVQDDSGKTWNCSEAFTTEPPSMSGGEIDVSMQFKRAEEVL